MIGFNPNDYVSIPFIDLDAMAKEQKARLEMSARTKLNDDGALVLTIPHSLAHQLELATGELPYLLGNAAGVFELLYDIHSAGFDVSPSGMLGVLELCKRGLQSAADNEGETISKFDTILRQALAAEGQKRALDAVRKEQET